MRQLTKLSVIENLTYEESEIRLILLGVISSICLVTCATAFALIVNRISGYFKDPIIVPYQSPSYQTIGFPIPTILVIDHTGSFLTYRTRGIRNTASNMVSSIFDGGVY